MPRFSIFHLLEVAQRVNFYDLTYYNNNPGYWYEYELQWWRLVLGGLWLGEILSATVKVYLKTSLGSGRSVYMMDVILLVLTAVNYFLWTILFSDQSQILNVPRPSQRYRRTVWIIVVCSTVPGILINVSGLLKLSIVGSNSYSWRNEVIAHILQLVLGLLSAKLVHWMAKQFLLDKDIEGPYEPVTSECHRTRSSAESSNPSSQESDTTTRPLPIPLEAMSTTKPLAWNLLASSHLVMAYSEQQTGEGRNQASSISSLGGQAVGSALDDTVFSSLAGSSTRHSGQENLPNPLKCRTIAKFDYTPLSQTGLHSWASWRVVRIMIAVLTTYNLIALNYVLLLAMPYKKLGFPLFKAMITLLFPLEGLILCCYSSWPHKRRGWFSRSHLSLPPLWERSNSVLGRTVYVNSMTDTSNTANSPYRSFHLEHTIANHELVSVRNRRLHSQTKSRCDDYLGHRGRSWDVQCRHLTIILAIISLVFLLVVLFLLINSYLDTDPLFQNFRTLPYLQSEEFLRFRAITALYLFNVGSFGSLLFFYTWMEIFSTVILWRHSAMNNGDLSGARNVFWSRSKPSNEDRRKVWHVAYMQRSNS